MADLDELLKLLEQEVQKKREDAKASSPSSKDSFERFIEDIGVKKGLDRIPNYVVFYTYKKVYKKALGEKRYSKIHFFRRMSQFFDTARVGKQRYYLLDKDSFDKKLLKLELETLAVDAKREQIEELRKRK